MAAKKRGLGRGLDALLGGNTVSALQEEAAQVDTRELQYVPLELIQRGKYQPRRDMDQTALEELAASIRAQGVMQPIVLRPIGNGRFEIVAGERRWRASQLAGQDKIPAMVRDLPDEAAIAMALIENIQREDLNPLEEAEALKKTAAVLLSVCGVGPVVGATLLAYLPELGQLSEKEIASLAGLAPVADDSGKRRGRRHIAEGRAKVRHALYMAVVAALKNNAYLCGVYQRLIRTGKPVKVAMVAVMRKLLVMLNAMVRDGTTWEPDSETRKQRRLELADQGEAPVREDAQSIAA